VTYAYAQQPMLSVDEQRALEISREFENGAGEGHRSSPAAEPWGFSRRDCRGHLDPRRRHAKIAVGHALSGYTVAGGYNYPRWHGNSHSIGSGGYLANAPHVGHRERAAGGADWDRE
jgi:hypothetical protein